MTDSTPTPAPGTETGTGTGTSDPSAPSDEAQAALKGLKCGTTALSLMGVLMIVLGFVAIGSPLAAGEAITLIVGVLLLVGGVVQLGSVFSAKLSGKAGSVLLTLLGGFLALVAGVLVILHPLLGLTFLTWLLGVFFTMDGVASLVAAFKARPQRGWGLTLFSGLVTVLLAVLIIAQWPLSAAWAVGVLVGVSLIFRGWTLIAYGSAIRAGAQQISDRG